MLQPHRKVLRAVLIRWVMYGASGGYHIGSFEGDAFQAESEEMIRFCRRRSRFASKAVR